MLSPYNGAIARVKPAPIVTAASLFRSTFLLRELAKRDFESRYAGSWLGFLWSFAQPLWLLALFTFVFSTVLQVAPTGERTASFAVFLFCGLLPWMAVHEAVNRSATVITDNASLVKKVSFRAELLVFSVVVTALLHEAIAFVVFVLVLAATGQLAGGGLLPGLLVAVPLQILLTVGLGLLVASAQVFLRDTSQALALLLNGWFYLTPIVYPLSYVPERLRGWVECNPLTVLVGWYRYALVGGGAPGGTGGLALTAAAVAVLGGVLFRRLAPTFADEI